MQFTSISFILLFTAFFWLFWLCGKTRNVQNWLLLIASYAFYAYFDWRCAMLLFFTSFSVYLAGLYFKRKGASKTVCATTIVLNLAILGFFKYCNFFLLTISDLSGGGMSLYASFCR